MAFGVTPSGFTRKTFEDIKTSTFAFLREKISKVLDLSERDPLGNATTVLNDEIAAMWEHIEAAYNAYDPDNADDDRFRALCLITGVVPGGATKGTVAATVNLDASQSFLPGTMIANVVGEPSNLWTNVNTVTSTVSGDYQADFIATVAGVIGVAPAGSLIEITTSLSGWNSITNAQDALSGVDFESLEDLRARRDASIAVTGTGTVPAIKADVAAINGVISVNVAENTGDTVDADSLPPHSFSVTIWDGPLLAADSDEIAQAVFDSQPAGIAAVGSTAATATDTDGVDHLVEFSRAAQVLIEATATIDTDREIDVEDVKLAMVASHNDETSVDVNYNQLTCSVFNVAGVTDWTAITVNIVGDSAGTISIPISINEVGLMDTSRITIVINP